MRNLSIFTPLQTKLLIKLASQLMAIAALIFSSSALAHTGLASSSPSSGAIVNQAPEQLSLTFSGDVTLVRLAVTNQQDQQLGIDFSPARTPQAVYQISLPVLAAGRFTVQWAAIGEDGHTLTETFTFVVDPTAQPSAGQAPANHHTH